MKSRKFKSRAVLVPAVLLSTVAATQLGAANMRSFIEGVRRKAAVVYVGTVKEVRVLERTKFDIRARAIVSVSAVARGATSGTTEATIDYSSYDEQTRMLDGGPQYQLRPGMMVIAFAESFRNSIPPGYLLFGSQEELLGRVNALRDKLMQMSSDELKRNEIDEADREVQLALYEKLRGQLEAHR